MLELFLLYEDAVMLKSLGFNEPCLGYWDTATGRKIKMFKYKAWKRSTNSEANAVTSPLYQQAFEWFREQGASNWIEEVYSDDKSSYTQTYIIFYNGKSYGGDFKTYKEAKLNCLKKLIEIVEEKE